MNQDEKILTESAKGRVPFVSRFNQWMKAIAIVVIAVFIPDQASWAFGYNPSVLYKNLAVSAAPVVGMPLLKSTSQIASGMEYLLKEIQDKPPVHLQLNLDQDVQGVIARSEATKQSHTLDIDTKTSFNAEKIHNIIQWLYTPDLRILNCGVYSLKDILEANGIKRSLPEISVMTLSVDIMSDIIKIGEPKLKTTLLAISKTAKALGVNDEAMKLDPSDTLNLKTPFIAHFKNEHFVTVMKVAGGQVYYTDLGFPRIVSQEEFLSNADGFVLAQVPDSSDSVIASPSLDSVIARSPQGDEAISYQIVPDALQAFVWGDKYRDLSKNLPGYISGDDFWTQLGVAILIIIISFAASYAGGAIFGAAGSAASAVASGAITTGQALAMTAAVSAMLSYSLGTMMHQLESICVLEKACDPETAMILGMALSVAISFGVSAAGNALASASQAGTDTIKSAAVSQANDAAQAATQDTLSNPLSAINNPGLSPMDGFNNPASMSSGGAPVADISPNAQLYGNQPVGATDAFKATYADALANPSPAALSQAAAASSNVLSASAGKITGAFVTGFAIGLVTGYVEYKWDKLVSSWICPDPANCSEENQIWIQVVDAVGPTIAMVGVDLGVAGLDAIGVPVGQYFTPKGSNVTDFSPGAGDMSNPISLGSLLLATGEQFVATEIGQVAGALVRIVILPDKDGNGGISSQDVLSQAIGQGVSMIVSSGVGIGINAFNVYMAQQRSTGPPTAETVATEADKNAVKHQSPENTAAASKEEALINSSGQGPSSNLPSAVTLANNSAADAQTAQNDAQNASASKTTTPQTADQLKDQLNHDAAVTIEAATKTSVLYKGQQQRVDVLTTLAKQNPDDQNFQTALTNAKVELGEIRYADQQANEAAGKAKSLASWNTQVFIHEDLPKIIAAGVLGLVTVGMGAIAHELPGGAYDKEANNPSSPQYNPRYNYEYATQNAGVNLIALTASSVMSGLILSGNPNTFALNSTNPDKNTDQSSMGSRFNQIMFTTPADVTNTTATIFQTGGGPITATVPESEYSPSMLLNFVQGFGGANYMSQAALTGSWGSVANVVNFADVRGEMTGFTPTSVISLEGQWNNMQQQNVAKTTVQVEKGTGGIMTAVVTTTQPLSQDLLYKQFMENSWASGSIGAPGISPYYIQGQAGAAANQSIQNLLGVMGHSLITPTVSKESIQSALQSKGMGIDDANQAIQKRVDKGVLKPGNPEIPIADQTGFSLASDLPAGPALSRAKEILGDNFLAVLPVFQQAQVSAENIHEGLSMAGLPDFRFANVGGASFLGKVDAGGTYRSSDGVFGDVMSASKRPDYKGWGDFRSYNYELSLATPRDFALNREAFWEGAPNYEPNGVAGLVFHPDATAALPTSPFANKDIGSAETLVRMQGQGTLISNDNSYGLLPKDFMQESLDLGVNGPSIVIHGYQPQGNNVTYSINNGFSTTVVANNNANGTPNWNFVISGGPGAEVNGDKINQGYLSFTQNKYQYGLPVIVAQDGYQLAYAPTADGHGNLIDHLTASVTGHLSLGETASFNNFLSTTPQNQINPVTAAQHSKDRDFGQMTGFVFALSDDWAKAGALAPTFTTFDATNSFGQHLASFTGSNDNGKQNGIMIYGGDFSLDNNRTIKSNGGSNVINYTGVGRGGFGNIFNLPQSSYFWNTFKTLDGNPGLASVTSFSQYNSGLEKALGGGSIDTYAFNYPSAPQNSQQKPNTSTENPSGMTPQKEFHSLGAQEILKNGQTFANATDLVDYHATGTIAPGAILETAPQSPFLNTLFNVTNGGVIQADENGNAKLYSVINDVNALKNTLANGGFKLDLKGTPIRAVYEGNPTFENAGQKQAVNSVTSFLAKVTGTATAAGLGEGTLELPSSSSLIVYSLANSGGMPTVYLDKSIIASVDGAQVAPGITMSGGIIARDPDAAKSGYYVMKDGQLKPVAKFDLAKENRKLEFLSIAQKNTLKTGETWQPELAPVSIDWDAQKGLVFIGNAFLEQKNLQYDLNASKDGIVKKPEVSGAAAGMGAFLYPTAIGAKGGSKESAPAERGNENEIVTDLAGTPMRNQNSQELWMAVSGPHVVNDGDKVNLPVPAIGDMPATTITATVVEQDDGSLAYVGKRPNGKPVIIPIEESTQNFSFSTMPKFLGGIEELVPNNDNAARYFSTSRNFVTLDKQISEAGKGRPAVTTTTSWSYGPVEMWHGTTFMDPGAWILKDKRTETKGMSAGLKELGRTNPLQLLNRASTLSAEWDMGLLGMVYNVGQTADDYKLLVPELHTSRTDYHHFDSEGQVREGTNDLRKDMAYDGVKSNLDVVFGNDTFGQNWASYDNKKDRLIVPSSKYIDLQTATSTQIYSVKNNTSGEVQSILFDPLTITFHGVSMPSSGALENMTLTGGTGEQHLTFGPEDTNRSKGGPQAPGMANAVYAKGDGGTGVYLFADGKPFNKENILSDSDKKTVGKGNFSSVSVDHRAELYSLLEAKGYIKDGVVQDKYKNLAPKSGIADQDTGLGGFAGQREEIYGVLYGHYAAVKNVIDSANGNTQFTGRASLYGGVNVLDPTIKIMDASTTTDNPMYLSKDLVVSSAEWQELSKTPEGRAQQANWKSTLGADGNYYVQSIGWLAYPNSDNGKLASIVRTDRGLMLSDHENVNYAIDINKEHGTEAIHRSEYSDASQRNIDGTLKSVLSTTNAYTLSDILTPQQQQIASNYGVTSPSEVMNLLFTSDQLSGKTLDNIASTKIAVIPEGIDRIYRTGDGEARWQNVDSYFNVVPKGDVATAIQKIDNSKGNGGGIFTSQDGQMQVAVIGGYRFLESDSQWEGEQKASHEEYVKNHEGDIFLQEPEQNRTWGPYVTGKVSLPASFSDLASLNNGILSYPAKANGEQKSNIDRVAGFIDKNKGDMSALQQLLESAGIEFKGQQLNCSGGGGCIQVKSTLKDVQIDRESGTLRVIGDKAYIDPRGVKNTEFEMPYLIDQALADKLTGKSSPSQGVLMDQVSLKGLPYKTPNDEYISKATAIGVSPTDGSVLVSMDASAGQGLVLSDRGAGNLQSPWGTAGTRITTAQDSSGSGEQVVAQIDSFMQEHGYAIEHPQPKPEEHLYVLGGALTPAGISLGIALKDKGQEAVANYAWDDKGTLYTLSSKYYLDEPLPEQREHLDGRSSLVGATENLWSKYRSLMVYDPSTGTTHKQWVNVDDISIAREAEKMGGNTKITPWESALKGLLVQRNRSGAWSDTDSHAESSQRFSMTVKNPETGEAVVRTGYLVGDIAAPFMGALMKYKAANGASYAFSSEMSASFQEISQTAQAADEMFATKMAAHVAVAIITAPSLVTGPEWEAGGAAIVTGILSRVAQAGAMYALGTAMKVYQTYSEIDGPRGLNMGEAFDALAFGASGLPARLFAPAEGVSFWSVKNLVGTGLNPNSWGLLPTRAVWATAFATIPNDISYAAQEKWLSPDTTIALATVGALSGGINTMAAQSSNASTLGRLVNMTTVSGLRWASVYALSDTAAMAWQGNNHITAGDVFFNAGRGLVQGEKFGAAMGVLSSSAVISALGEGGKLTNAVQSFNKLNPWIKYSAGAGLGAAGMGGAYLGNTSSDHPFNGRDFSLNLVTGALVGALTVKYLSGNIGLSASLKNLQSPEALDNALFRGAVTWPAVSGAFYGYDYIKDNVLGLNPEKKYSILDRENGLMTQMIEAPKTGLWMAPVMGILSTKAKGLPELAEGAGLKDQISFKLGKALNFAQRPFTRASGEEIAGGAANHLWSSAVYMPTVVSAANGLAKGYNSLLKKATGSQEDYLGERGQQYVGYVGMLSAPAYGAKMDYLMQDGQTALSNGYAANSPEARKTFFADATSKFQEAVKLDGNNTQAWEGLALAQHGSGETAKAVEIYQSLGSKAIEKGDQNTVNMAVRGLAQMGSEGLQAARDLNMEASKPGNFSDLTIFTQRQSILDHAVELSKVQTQPGEAASATGLGINQAPVPSIEEMVRTAPQGSPQRQALVEDLQAVSRGLSSAASNRPSIEAGAMLEGAMRMARVAGDSKLAGQLEASTLRVQALKELKLGNIGKALELSGQLVSKNGNDANAHLFDAEILAKSGAEVGDVKQVLDRALALDSSSRTHYAAAEIYRGIIDKEDGRTDLVARNLSYETRKTGLDKEIANTAPGSYRDNLRVESLVAQMALEGGREQKQQVIAKLRTLATETGITEGPAARALRVAAEKDFELAKSDAKPEERDNKLKALNQANLRADLVGLKLSYENNPNLPDREFQLRQIQNAIDRINTYKPQEHAQAEKEKDLTQSAEQKDIFDKSDSIYREAKLIHSVSQAIELQQQGVVGMLSGLHILNRTLEGMKPREGETRETAEARKKLEGEIKYLSSLVAVKAAHENAETKNDVEHSGELGKILDEVKVASEGGKVVPGELRTKIQDAADKLFNEQAPPQGPPLEGAPARTGTFDRAALASSSRTYSETLENLDRLFSSNQQNTYLAQTRTLQLLSRAPETARDRQERIEGRQEVRDEVTKILRKVAYAVNRVEGSSLRNLEWNREEVLELYRKSLTVPDDFIEGKISGQSVRGRVGNGEIRWERTGNETIDQQLNGIKSREDLGKAGEVKTITGLKVTDFSKLVDFLKNNLSIWSDPNSGYNLLQMREGKSIPTIDGLAESAIGAEGRVLAKGTGGGKTMIELIGDEMNRILYGEGKTLIVTPKDTNIDNYIQEINKLATGRKYLVIANDKAWTIENGKKEEVTGQRDYGWADTIVIHESEVNREFLSGDEGRKLVTSIRDGNNNRLIADDFHEMTRGAGLVMSAHVTADELFKNDQDGQNRIERFTTLLRSIADLTRESILKNPVTAEPGTEAPSEFVEQILNQIATEESGLNNDKAKGVVRDIIRSTYRQNASIETHGYYVVVKGEIDGVAVRGTISNGTRDASGKVRIFWDHVDDAGIQTKLNNIQTLDQVKNHPDLGRDFVLAESGNSKKDHIFHSAIDAAVTAHLAGASSETIRDYLARPKEAPSANFLKIMREVGADKIAFFSATPDLSALRAAGLNVDPAKIGENHGDLAWLGEAPKFTADRLSVGVFDGGEALRTAIQDVEHSVTTSPNKLVEAISVDNGRDANTTGTSLRKSLNRENFSTSEFDGIESIKGTRLDPNYKGKDAVWEAVSPAEPNIVRVRPEVRLTEADVKAMAGEDTGKLWGIVQRAQGRGGESIYVYDVSGLEAKAEEEKIVKGRIQEHMARGEKVIVIFTRFDAGLNTLEIKSGGVKYSANIRQVGDLMDRVAMEQLIGRGSAQGATDSRRATLEDNQLHVYLDGSRLNQTEQAALAASSKPLNETVFDLAEQKTRDIGEDVERRTLQTMLGLRPSEGEKGQAANLAQVTGKFMEDLRQEQASEYGFMAGVNLSAINTIAEADSHEQAVLHEATEAMRTTSSIDYTQNLKKDTSGTGLMNRVANLVSTGAITPQQALPLLKQSYQINQASQVSTGTLTGYGQVLLDHLVQSQANGRSQNLQSIQEAVNNEIMFRVNNGFKVSNNKSDDGSYMWLKHDPSGRYVDIISHGGITHTDGSNGEQVEPIHFVQRYYFGIGKEQGHMGDAIVLLKGKQSVLGIQNEDKLNHQGNLIIGNDSAVKAVIDAGHRNIHVPVQTDEGRKYQFIRNTANTEFLISLGLNPWPHAKLTEAINKRGVYVVKAEQIKIDAAEIEKRIKDRNQGMENVDHLLQIRRDAMKKGKPKEAIEDIETNIVEEIRKVAAPREWFAVPEKDKHGKYWLRFAPDKKPPQADLLAGIIKTNAAKGWEEGIVIDFDLETKGTAAEAGDDQVKAGIGTLMKALSENSLVSTIVFKHENIHVIDRFVRKNNEQVRLFYAHVTNIKAANGKTRERMIAEELAHAKNPYASKDEMDAAEKYVLEQQREETNPERLNLLLAQKLWEAKAKSDTELKGIDHRLAGIKAEDKAQLPMELGKQIALARNDKATEEEIKSATDELNKMVVPGLPPEFANQMIYNAARKQMWDALSNRNGQEEQKPVQAITSQQGVMATTRYVKTDVKTIEKDSFARILAARGGWSADQIEKAWNGVAAQEFIEHLGDGSSALKKDKFYNLGGRPFHDSGELSLPGFQEKERRDLFAALNGGIEIGIYDGAAALGEVRAHKREARAYLLAALEAARHGDMAKFYEMAKTAPETYKRGLAFAFRFSGLNDEAIRVLASKDEGDGAESVKIIENGQTAKITLKSIGQELYVSLPADLQGKKPQEILGRLQDLLKVSQKQLQIQILQTDTLLKVAQNHYNDPTVFRLVSSLSSNNFSDLAKEAGIPGTDEITMERLVAAMLGDKSASKKVNGDGTVTLSLGSQKISFEAKTGRIVAFEGYQAADLSNINDGWGKDREVALLEAGISTGTGEQAEKIRAIVRQRYERNQKALEEASGQDVVALSPTQLEELRSNKIPITSAFQIYKRPGDGNLVIVASDARVANRLVERIQPFVEGRDPGTVPEEEQSQGVSGMDWTLEETAEFLNTAAKGELPDEEKALRDALVRGKLLSESNGRLVAPQNKTISMVSKDDRKFQRTFNHEEDHRIYKTSRAYRQLRQKQYHETSKKFQDAFMGALVHEKGSIYGADPHVVYKEFSAYGLDPEAMKEFLGRHASGLEDEIQKIAMMLQKTVISGKPGEQVFNIYRAIKPINVRGLQEIIDAKPAREQGLNAYEIQDQPILVLDFNAESLQAAGLDRIHHFVNSIGRAQAQAESPRTANAYPIQDLVGFYKAAAQQQAEVRLDPVELKIRKLLVDNGYMEEVPVSTLSSKEQNDLWKQGYAQLSVYRQLKPGALLAVAQGKAKNRTLIQREYVRSMYFTDDIFQKRINDLWESLSKQTKEKIQALLGANGRIKDRDELLSKFATYFRDPQNVKGVAKNELKLIAARIQSFEQAYQPATFYPASIEGQTVGILSYTDKPAEEHSSQVQAFLEALIKAAEIGEIPSQVKVFPDSEFDAKDLIKARGDKEGLIVAESNLDDPDGFVQRLKLEKQKAKEFEEARQAAAKQAAAEAPGEEGTPAPAPSAEQGPASMPATVAPAAPAPANDFLTHAVVGHTEALVDSLERLTGKGDVDKAQSAANPAGIPPAPGSSTVVSAVTVNNAAMIAYNDQTMVAWLVKKSHDPAQLAVDLATRFDYRVTEPFNLKPSDAEAFLREDVWPDWKAACDIIKSVLARLNIDQMKSVLRIALKARIARGEHADAAQGILAPEVTVESFAELFEQGLGKADYRAAGKALFEEAVGQVTASTEQAAEKIAASPSAPRNDTKAAQVQVSPRGYVRVLPPPNLPHQGGGIRVGVSHRGGGITASAQNPVSYATVMAGLDTASEKIWNAVTTAVAPHQAAVGNDRASSTLGNGNGGIFSNGNMTTAPPEAKVVDLAQMAHDILLSSARSNHPADIILLAKGTDEIPGMTMRDAAMADSAQLIPILAKAQAAQKIASPFGLAMTREEGLAMTREEGLAMTGNNPVGSSTKVSSAMISRNSTMIADSQADDVAQVVFYAGKLERWLKAGGDTSDPKNDQATLFIHFALLGRSLPLQDNTDESVKKTRGIPPEEFLDFDTDGANTAGAEIKKALSGPAIQEHRDRLRRNIIEILQSIRFKDVNGNDANDKEIARRMEIIKTMLAAIYGAMESEIIMQQVANQAQGPGNGMGEASNVEQGPMIPPSAPLPVVPVRLHLAMTAAGEEETPRYAQAEKIASPSGLAMTRGSGVVALVPANDNYEEPLPLAANDRAQLAAVKDDGKIAMLPSAPRNDTRENGVLSAQSIIPFTMLMLGVPPIFALTGWMLFRHGSDGWKWPEGPQDRGGSPAILPTGPAIPAPSTQRPSEPPKRGGPPGPFGGSGATPPLKVIMAPAPLRPAPALQRTFLEWKGLIRLGLFLILGWLTGPSDGELASVHGDSGR